MVLDALSALLVLPVIKLTARNHVNGKRPMKNKKRKVGKFKLFVLCTGCGNGTKNGTLLFQVPGTKESNCWKVSRWC